MGEFDSNWRLYRIASKLENYILFAEKLSAMLTRTRSSRNLITAAWRGGDGKRFIRPNYSNVAS